MAVASNIVAAINHHQGKVSHIVLTTDVDPGLSQGATGTASDMAHNLTWDAAVTKVQDAFPGTDSTSKRLEVKLTCTMGGQGLKIKEDTNPTTGQLTVTLMDAMSRVAVATAPSGVTVTYVNDPDACP
jgi:hypothetical protein